MKLSIPPTSYSSVRVETFVSLPIASIYSYIFAVLSFAPYLIAWLLLRREVANVFDVVWLCEKSAYIRPLDCLLTNLVGQFAQT